jgi:hypothetical protein
MGNLVPITISVRPKIAFQLSPFDRTAEEIAAQSPKDWARLICRRFDVKGDRLPEYEAEQMVEQLSMFAPDAFLSVVAAAALAAYGENNKKARLRLAVARLAMRQMAFDAFPDQFVGVVDDLGVEKDGADGSNVADRLLKLTESAGWQYWMDTRTADAMVTIAPGRHVALRSGGASHALTLLWEASGNKPRVLPNTAAPTVRAHLEAQCARPDTPRFRSAVRVGWGACGTILIDRGTEDFSAYSVSETSIGIVNAEAVTREGVRFVRHRGYAALTEADLSTTLGDAVTLMGQFFTLNDKRDLWVLAGQIISSWLPGESYSMFVIVGDHGGGKTSTARAIKDIIDPEAGNVSRRSPSVNDLYVMASKRLAIAQDNLTAIPHELSDAYCGVATGSNERVRRKYTDDDEVTLFCQAAIILTAMDDAILKRPDILDRATLFRVKRLTKALTDEETRKLSERLRPKIVGGLLNGLANVLLVFDPSGNGPDSRMSATVATLRALDLIVKPSPEAEKRYREMRADAAGVNLAENDFTAAVLSVIYAAPLASDGVTHEWVGGAADLLDAARVAAGLLRSSPPGWPQTAAWAGRRIRELAPTFERAEVSFEELAAHKARRLRLSAKGATLAAWGIVPAKGATSAALGTVSTNPAGQRIP